MSTQRAEFIERYGHAPGDTGDMYCDFCGQTINHVDDRHVVTVESHGPIYVCHICNYAAGDCTECGIPGIEGDPDDAKFNNAKLTDGICADCAEREGE